MSRRTGQFRRSRVNQLVSRFRSSQNLVARSHANFGIKGTLPSIYSSAPLNPKFANRTRGTGYANFGFGALEPSRLPRARFLVRSLAGRSNSGGRASGAKGWSG